MEQVCFKGYAGSEAMKQQGDERDHEWYSDNGRFGIRLSVTCLSQLLSCCQQAGAHETGGILAGKYSAALDVAQVTRVSPVPPDSRQGPTWFERGTVGLQGWLDTLWAERHEYYLGEWHYHPAAVPEPSWVDRIQMRRIARASAYSCPEPLLLILSGSSAAHLTVRAFVVPRGDNAIPLRRRETDREVEDAHQL